jgi:VIT1/CCC1 family predicted Fe2+/Mn2+ transporter
VSEKHRHGESSRKSHGLLAVGFSGISFAAAAFAFAPMVASAAVAHRTLGDLITTATEVIWLAVPFGLLLLLFFWSMAQLVMTTGDAEKRKQAKQRIVWGIIAIFVIFSLGGLIAAINGTFFGGDSLQTPGGGP